MTQRPINDIRDDLGERGERMIAIQMGAYPSDWTDADKRDLAIKHLFGAPGAFTHEEELK